MVTSEKAHETATGLLTGRLLLLLLLLLLLRLSATIKKATHKLSGNTTKASRAPTGLRSLTVMLPTQQRVRKAKQRRLILRLMFSTGDCVHRQILIIVRQPCSPGSSSIHIHLIGSDPFPHPLLSHPFSRWAAAGKDLCTAGV